MSRLILAGVVMMLLPLVVMTAMAVRLAYDDWAERRATRQRAARVKALGVATTLRLIPLDGGGLKPSTDGEPHGRTA
jgi:hypothetical protein